MIKRAVPLKIQAYQLILESIVNNEIRTEDIYSEQWFADRFNISRTPVREALLQLQSENLIETLPNRGVVVKRATLKEAKDIFQMRTAIEGYCSELLAREANSDRGKEVLKRVEYVLENCRNNFTRDNELQFHLEIIQFADNPEFIKQFNNMRARIDIFWNYVRQSPDREDEIYNEHKKILDRMKNGDVIGAFFANEEHMEITLQKLKNSGFFDK